ncbi:MAG: sporulation membrane protein YtaF [bacterium]|nr:sporulation membrane protein YtaF [bacterium]
MSLLSSLALAVALSLDGLGVGVAYGIRGIRVPVCSLGILGVCTGGLMAVSMTAGQFLASLTARAGTVGGLLLVAVGTWQLVQGWRNYLTGLEDSKRPLLHLRVTVLGVAVQVLRDPVQVDVDNSGTIDTRESLLLGGALGLDAFAAGFAAAMVGFPLWIVPAVIITCMVFVAVGAWLGVRAVSGRRAFFALPGLLLIAIGLMRL